MAKCKKCGNNIKADDNFCKKCGAPAEISNIDECTNCGFHYAEGDNFCKKCGHKIDKVEKIVAENANFDYRKDYDKLYEEDSIADKKDEEIKEYKKGNISKKVDEKEKVKGYPEEDPEFNDGGFNEDDLEVPSFFNKSKKTINAMFSGEDKPKKIFEDQDEIKFESDEVERENMEHTILLPNLDEYENSSKLEDRAVLSEEKKRLIRESKQKADGINHDFGSQDQSDDQELTDTQKIRLQAEEEKKFVERRIRTSSRKKVNKEETKKDIKKVTKKENTKDKSNKKEFKFSNFIIPILVILAALSVLFATLSGITDKKRVIAKFEQSITSEDDELAAKILRTTGDEIVVDSQDIHPFMELMRNDQIYRSSLLGAVKEDSSKLSIDDEYKSSRPYRLESVGNKFIFFKDYKIIVDPLLLNIIDNDRTIYLNSEKFESGVENLKLIPGIYNISTDESEENYQINLSPTNESLVDGALTVSLSDLLPVEIAEDKAEEETVEEKPEEEIEPEKNLEGDTEFHIDSAHKDAIVFINGESTGLTLEKYNDIALKSIKNGDKIKLGLNYPWGMSFSNEIEYAGEQVISLFIEPDNASTMEYIMGKVEKMLKEDGAARRNMTMDGFTTIIEPEVSATKEIIDNGKQNGMVYYRVYDQIKYDPESFEVITGENGSYTAYIGGELIFRAYEYPEGSSLDEGFEPYGIDEIMGFHLTFMPDKNDWFVNSWGYTERYINLENPIVHDIGE
ncbi:MAG: zinc ribbon domain-containing protein [Tissierellia bacterium]|nr:zinc ribbon domain-containing protein [Tissierellia bacterium]